MKKTIIEKMKSWSIAIFIMVFMTIFTIIPCLYFGELSNAFIETWHDMNLLYIPDLLGFIAIIGVVIILPLYSILTIAYVIGYIIYKFYTYFFKKDRNALKDILDELVYKF